MKNTPYHDKRVVMREHSYLSNGIPSRYVFVLTNKCNLSCDFCFQERKSLPGAMSADDWMRVIAKLPIDSHITFTGGEPLLFKDFERIYREAAKKSTLNIICNGVLLTNKVVDFLLDVESLMVLSISVDTVGNINRAVKPLDYQMMTNSLHYFKLEKIRKKHQAIIDTKTVVTNENTKNLFNIFKHCIEDLGAESHSFQFLKGSPLQHSDKVTNEISDIYQDSKLHLYLDVKEIANQFNLVREYCINNDVRCFTHPGHIDFSDTNQNFFEIINTYINSRKFNIESYYKCMAPWESVHINADGKTFPCLAYNFGDIRNYDSVDELYKDGPATNFRKILKEHGLVSTCAGCGYLKKLTN